MIREREYCSSSTKPHTDDFYVNTPNRFDDKKILKKRRLDGNCKEESNDDDFNYGDVVGADVGGAITGGIVGSFAGGIGTAPGAIGGGCGASIGVGISQLWNHWTK